MIVANTEQLQELLSLAYATTTNRAGWSAFCRALNRATDVPIMMFGHDLKRNESLGIIASGLNPSALERYHSDFADKNPWMHMNAVMPMGAVGISDQALSRRELFKTEFYNDWLRQQDNVVAGPFMVCYRSDDRFVGMAAACRARNIDHTLARSHGLFSALAPHITRAIQMSEVLCANGGASFAHLQASRHAIFILRRSGKLEFINQAAARFISAGDALSTSVEALLVGKGEKLRTYVHSLTQAVSTCSVTARPPPMAISTRAFGACVLRAHIFPADAEHGFPDSTWTDPTAGALVISGRFGLEPPDTFARLALALGATNAEAQLAQALCEGVSLNDYAELHALSRHTVRNQMRALLHKMSAHNQADFVRRIHQLSSPFDDF